MERLRGKMYRLLRLPRVQMGVKRSVARLYASEQTTESVVMARNRLHARFDRITAEVHRELCAKIAPRPRSEEPARTTAGCA